MERRIVINTVGPVWEGNQVWFILGGGAIFAAWPPLYAVAFSGFYLAMLLLLFALILRPVGFKFRSKLADPRWRTRGTAALFVGGAVPALVFGVAFGNLFLGLPFRFDELRARVHRQLLGAAQPVRAALRPGQRGDARHARRVYAALKVGPPMSAARRRWGAVAALVFVDRFHRGRRLDGGRIDGHRIRAGGRPLRSAPTRWTKEVALVPGAGSANFRAHAVLWLAAGARGRWPRRATWRCSALRRDGRHSCAARFARRGTILTAGVALFPFLMPSSTQPEPGPHGLGCLQQRTNTRHHAGGA